MRSHTTAHAGRLAQIGIAVLLAVASAPVRAACTATITTGFSGDLNAVYPDNQGGTGGNGGGDGGGGSGGDGGGGAGAGAGEGKVLSGMMTMTRLSDGVVLGSAPTDGVNGLVTIKPCAVDGPLLLSLAGRAGANYFDEGMNRLVPFDGTRTLHALVDKFDENIGVSALTEAAYRYAINHFIVNPAQVASGAVPLQTTATPAQLRVLTAAQIQQANAVVLAELNGKLNANYQLTSVRSLPTPLDQASATSVIASNRYGRSAAVTGGISAMARVTQPVSALPGLDAGEQLANDLTDGKLDGFALDGRSAARSTALITYDAPRFPVALQIGVNSVAQRFGNTTTFADGAGVAEVTSVSVPQFLCQSATGDSASLLKDGTITVLRNACDGNGVTTTINNFATHAKLIEGSGGDQNFPNRGFFVRDDGTLWGWGSTNCGMLGNGVTAANYLTDPVRIQGIQNVTSIATGVFFNLARDSTGAVYSWGVNYNGTLGLGSAAIPGSVICAVANQQPPFDQERSVLAPMQVPGLSNIATVATDLVTSFALDVDGNLYQWGLIPIGYNFANAGPTYHGDFADQPTPTKVANLPKVVSIAVSYYMRMALAADGTVYGYGPNVAANFGDGTNVPHLIPSQVPGLSHVTEIAASVNSPFVALLQDGTVRYWGGCCVSTTGVIDPWVARTPQAPAPGGIQFYSPRRGVFTGTLPPIRHIKGNGGKVLLYGVDGSIYQFPRTQSDLTIVVAVEAAAGAAPQSGWWWNPNESGRGFSVEITNGNLFMAGYFYDAAGRATWGISGGKMTDATHYSGTLFGYSGGQTLTGAYVAPNPPAALGPVAITFSDATHGAISGAANTQIERFPFGPAGLASTPLPGIPESGWWWNSAESGRGYFIEFQGNAAFVAGYMYDATSNPVWYISGGLMPNAQSYSGSWSQYANGQTLSGSYKPATLINSNVGTLGIQFQNAFSATLTLPNGRQIPLTRFRF